MTILFIIIIMKVDYMLLLKVDTLEVEVKNLKQQIVGMRKQIKEMNNNLAISLSKKPTGVNNQPQTQIKPILHTKSQFQFNSLFVNPQERKKAAPQQKHNYSEWLKYFQREEPSTKIEMKTHQIDEEQEPEQEEKEQYPISILKPQRKRKQEQQEDSLDGQTKEYDRQRSRSRDEENSFVSNRTTKAKIASKEQAAIRKEKRLQQEQRIAEEILIAKKSAAQVAKECGKSLRSVYRYVEKWSSAITRKHS